MGPDSRLLEVSDRFPALTGAVVLILILAAALGALWVARRALGRCGSSTAVKAKLETPAPLEIVVQKDATPTKGSSAAVDPASLVLETPIGSGGQGGVWLARDGSTGKQLALKQIRKGRLASLKKRANVTASNCQWLLEREALLACSDHPFVTSCLATFQDDASLYFALELAPGGKRRARPDRAHALDLFVRPAKFPPPAHRASRARARRTDRALLPSLRQSS